VLCCKTYAPLREGKQAAEPCTAGHMQLAEPRWKKMRKCNDVPRHGLVNRLARERQRTRFLSSSTSLCLCSKDSGVPRVSARAAAGGGSNGAAAPALTLLTWKGVFLRWTLKENESLPMITRPQARAAHARPPARQAGGTAANGGSVCVADCATAPVCRLLCDAETSSLDCQCALLCIGYRGVS